jgi:hypothetical protein
MSNSAFKITVNQRATDTIFHDAAFIRFRRNEDTMLVRGAMRQTADAVPAARNQLGGLSLALTGEVEATIRALPSARAGRPSYGLVTAEGGWFEMQLTTTSLAKHIPSMRIWVPSEDASAETEADSSPYVVTGNFDPATLIATLRAAENVVKGHGSGQTSPRIRAAQRVLDAFQREAQRMGWIVADYRRVTLALNILKQYLTDAKPRPSSAPDVSKGRPTAQSRLLTAVKEAERSSG